MVESHGHHQYSVKMDGSGRVTLRNRRYLRKIEPYIPRHIGVEHIPLSNVGEVDDVKNHGGAEKELTADEEAVQIVDDQNLRRSTRIRCEPNR